MRARFVNENTFERGRSVKVTLGLGKRALIKKWFDDLGKSSDKYVINDDLSIDYNSWLNLENTKITKLPNNLTVNGYLNLTNTNITELPDNLNVHGSLYLENTNITELPDNLTVKGSLDLENTNITKLPDNLNIKKPKVFIKKTLMKIHSKEEEVLKPHLV